MQINKSKYRQTEYEYLQIEGKIDRKTKIYSDVKIERRQKNYK